MNSLNPKKSCRRSTAYFDVRSGTYLSERSARAARKSPNSRRVMTVCTFSFLMLMSAVAWDQALAVSSQLTEKVLYTFSISSPNGPLVEDESGNLYGTTKVGGDTIGTIFKLTPAGQESDLWDFGNGDPDGSLPLGGLIIDQSGNLYGTTTAGGIYDDFSTDFGGTVFKLTTSGQESILWSFGNGTDGQNPTGSLLMDASGNLFGTTYFGGTYLGGTAFELTPAGQESVLWNFGNGSDGSGPLTALISDASGNLYGTTVVGGTYDTNPRLGLGGTLFKLTPVTTPEGASAGTTYTESILWNFGHGTDGQNPGSSPILDASGNLFGVTGVGGLYHGGTVYEVTASGQESVLWNFGNGTDGQFPNGLIMDGDGNLFGVTQNGGTNLSCGFPSASCGTVYELTPPAVAGGVWSEAILWNFGPSPDGFNPYGNLLLDASGNLYGGTGGGGADGGTVFEISGFNPSGQIFLSAQHVQFAKTAVGGSSSYQLAIRNTGPGQLTGSIATPPAPFGLQGSGGFNLAPNTQTKITLTFDPAAPARVHKLTTVTSNSVKQSSIQLDLRGIGTVPPSLALNRSSSTTPETIR